MKIPAMTSDSSEAAPQTAKPASVAADSEDSAGAPSIRLPHAARGPRALRALAAGCLAGCFALGLDQLLAYLTLGFMVPLAARYLAAYVLLAAFVAVFFVTGAWLSRRRRASETKGRRIPGAWTVFAVAAAGVYAPAIAERVHHAFGNRAMPALAITIVTLAVAGYGLWIFVLGRVAGARAWALAPLLAAAGAAVGLAVNRNLVILPLEPLALAADAGVLVATLVLAYLGRIHGPRRALAVTAALALGVLAITVAGRSPAPSPSPASPAGEERPPNLVLVIIDTLRQDVFQAVVRRTEEGRAFRRALDGSAWFDRAIAAAPWTVPSVGSIMTGLYPQEHGFQAAPVKDPSRPLRPLAETVPTLAQQLHRLGYRTEAIGTNPLMQPVSGIARGFEHYEILSGPTVKLPPLTALVRLGLLSVDNYQQADSVRRRLRQRLNRMQADDRPVFLWLHLMDPHAPLKSHRDLPPDPRTAGLDEQRRLYRDEVRYALRELTSMLQLLRDHDRWQNTALVVVSDHGEMFPADGHDNSVKALGSDEPKLYGHGHAMYGELVRVPLVIRPPGGLPASRQVKVLTSHVDLRDTILDLLAVDGARVGGDRVSLAPWLAAEPPAPGLKGRGHALVGANQHGPRQRALRTRRLKLIDYPKDPERPAELYQVISDPGERRDLAGVQGDRLARVRKRLESLWEQLAEAPAAAPAELDAETLEKLKALGYVP